MKVKISVRDFSYLQRTPNDEQEDLEEATSNLTCVICSNFLKFSPFDPTCNSEARRNIMHVCFLFLKTEIDVLCVFHVLEQRNKKEPKLFSVKQKTVFKNCNQTSS